MKRNRRKRRKKKQKTRDVAQLVRALRSGRRGRRGRAGHPDWNLKEKISLSKSPTFFMIKENGQNSRRRQYYESFLQGGFHLCLIEAHNKRLDEGMSAEESEEIMRMEEKILASSVGLKVTFPNRKPKQRKQ